MNALLTRVASVVAFVNVVFSMVLRWNVPTTDLTDDWVVVAIMNLHVLMLVTCFFFAVSWWVRGRARWIGFWCHGVSFLLYATIAAWHLWGVRPGF